MGHRAGPAWLSVPGDGGPELRVISTWVLELPPVHSSRMNKPVAFAPLVTRPIHVLSLVPLFPPGRWKGPCRLTCGHEPGEGGVHSLGWGLKCQQIRVFDPYATYFYAVLLKIRRLQSKFHFQFLFKNWKSCWHQVPILAWPCLATAGQQLPTGVRRLGSSMGTGGLLLGLCMPVSGPCCGKHTCRVT